MKGNQKQDAKTRCFNFRSRQKQLSTFSLFLRNFFNRKQSKEQIKVTSFFNPHYPVLKAKSKKSFLSEQSVFRTTSAPSCLVPLFAYDVLSEGKRSAPSGWCFVGSDFNKFPSHGSTPAHTLLAPTHVGYCRIAVEH